MVSDARFHFDTTTWTRDGYQVSVRVVARAVTCYDYRTGKDEPWADVEHVEALEPVWMDEKVLIEQGQDVTADLDIREGHRIQNDAERILEEERFYERDEMADLKREA